MLRIGAHMSVAGGLSQAVARARLHACESLQIFAKNASQWRGTPLDPDDVRRFRSAVEASGLTPVVSHASYLINLAAAADPLRTQSIDALVDELDRAHALGLDGVVLHPGTCTSGSEVEALRLVAEAARRALAAHRSATTRLLFEHTAGQGRTVGWRFEQIAAILAHLDDHPRAGVCLDTCHLVASGYDITTDEGYAATMREFDRLIGLDRLSVIHANDSKKPCGSRVDRHEHIGQGCLGDDAFRRFFADPRLSGRPMIIETAKSESTARATTIALDPLDVRNLEALRRLRAEVAGAS